MNDPRSADIPIMATAQLNRITQHIRRTLTALIAAYLVPVANPLEFRWFAHAKAQELVVDVTNALGFKTNSPSASMISRL